MELIIKGRYDDAFAHMLLVGLASIVEDADPQRICELRWRDRDHAALCTSDDLTWEDCVAIVHDHAARWLASKWLNAKGAYDRSGSSVRATLSPRLGMPKPREGWTLLHHDREQAIDALLTPLDHRYIGSLGEPSYWSGDVASNQYDPDRGASLWEMVTRNKGQEFISGRLLPLAKAVAERSVEAVESGLRGETVNDEVGKNEPDSRTPTGLHRPFPTDNAQAWCALFGVSAFPVIRSVSTARGNTASFFTVARAVYTALPIWDEPWTVRRYASVVRSRALTVVGCHGAIASVPGKLRSDTGWKSEEMLTSTEIRRGERWLYERGVRCCMLFARHATAVKVPELWLQRGEPILLGEKGFGDA